MHSNNNHISFDKCFERAHTFSKLHYHDQGIFWTGILYSYDLNNHITPLHNRITQNLYNEIIPLNANETTKYTATHYN